MTTLFTGISYPKNITFHIENNIDVHVPNHSANLKHSLRFLKLFPAPVRLISKFNKLFLGYYAPVNVVFDHKQ